MNQRHSDPYMIGPLMRDLVAAVMLVASCAAGPAFAADKAELAAAQQRHRDEALNCKTGKSNQDRATCMKEADAALAEARRGEAAKPAADLAGNRTQRCDALPGDQRSACLARMKGQGTASGSVGAGGVLRELVTVERVPAASAPTPR